MDVELAFELVGSVPEEWAQDLAVYARALAEHPWGGAGLERLVVGDVNASLTVWMRSDEYNQWRASQAVRSVATGGKSFVARDGRRTAVVPLLGERELFLHLPGHEMVEAALDERQARERYEFVDGTHWGVSHVLWTEYVVERTRRGICNELGGGFSALDNGFVVGQHRDFENALPEMVRWAVANGSDPVESFQHFYELVRVYAMSRGRADAGSPADEKDLAEFAQATLGAELTGEWRRLDAAFQDAYDRPSEPTE
jgi:hypothetical protein